MKGFACFCARYDILAKKLSGRLTHGHAPAQRAGVFALAFLLCLLCALPAAATGTTGASGYDPNYPQNLSTNDLTATAVILVSMDTGEVIFEKNADQQMFPASTTKILTSYLALLYGDLASTTTVSATAMDIPSDSSKVPLAIGEEINLEDLIYATMLTSGNEGANAIAEAVAGSIPAFVELMNTYAASLGCTATHFNNAHGYHDEYHYTTARDMAVIARAAMQSERFRDIVSVTSYTLPKDNVYSKRRLISNNLFLQDKADSKSYYQYGTGIKTGSHSAAGHCYVGSAEKDGVSLLSVVFDARSDLARYTDTIKLMEYGFSQYRSTNVSDLYAMNPKVVDISYYALDDENLGKLTLALRLNNTDGDYSFVTTANNIDYLSNHLNDITVTEFTREFSAPITSGEVMGTLTYTNEAGQQTVCDLVATRDIERREKLAPTLADIAAYTEADPNPFPRITFEFVMLYIALPILGLLLLIRLLRFLFHKGKKRKPKVRTVEPTERFYR